MTSAEGPFSGYAEREDRPPFVAYATFAAVFNAGLAGGVAAARANGRELPERVAAEDIVLIGVASFKLSRIVAKDKITAFVRAPFTEFEEKGGPAEVEERSRGRGFRKAVGELLVCPYCLGLWFSGGFHVALLFAPRTTRFTASMLSALTLSDFLQLGHRAAEDKLRPS